MHDRTPRLWHYPLSPACRKVRLSLAEKRIEVALEETRYWERDEAFLRVAPAGKVPVLRIDGLTLSESAAICEYVEETRPEVPLMPARPRERHEARRLVAWFDDTFQREVTDRLLGERLHKKVQNKGYPSSAEVKAGAAAIRTHLDTLERTLERRRWMAGESLSLADFAGAAHLSCLDYISDVPWDAYEQVRNWYATIKSRPAFRGVLADQIPWQPPPRHYADLDF